nr:ribonuclease H-like domain-containing protein [Tanacetum cinerariifolium]
GSGGGSGGVAVVTSGGGVGCGGGAGGGEAAGGVVMVAVGVVVPAVEVVAAGKWPAAAGCCWWFACRGSDRSDKLKKHNQLLKLMQFLMDLDEIYAHIMSIILTTDPIPDVKRDFATLPRDESHRGFESHSVSKPEVSKLNMTVGHLTGIKAVDTHVGSLRLTDKIVIHDVLVVSGYETQSYVGNFSNGNDHIARMCSTYEDGIDLYDSDCDDISTAKAVLMANLSSYGSDVLSEGNMVLNPFNEETIPFKNSLQTLVKYFENGLLNELNEVKTVFNQMEAAVDQCSVDKKVFEIENK